ncbi:hypothetical protein [uncultured Vibrio sp.]|uniref:hypothetical protein n=1 Tax=uncultured Vibrio sp. TaxID=114054 RepID=UPI002AA6E823|nr:hypothetical protein [uncultured Vibrio sp.]
MLALKKKFVKAVLLGAFFAVSRINSPPFLHAKQQANTLERAYAFLVTPRDQGGILYTATAGELKGRQLPLSFYDTAAYWGEHVCAGVDCRVIDQYHPHNYTLLPRDSVAGDLQTERVNTHNGSNIYDAATWQIALLLGQSANGFHLPGQQDAYALAANQNLLLRRGHFGESPYPAPSQIRGISAGSVFIYNQNHLTDPAQAYAFRMLPRQWMAEDPFTGTSYARLLSGVDLPAFHPDYALGRISWTDWKPITGENAWAFFIGPLQAAAIHYRLDQPGHYLPLQDPALENALNILPTFAAMQSSVGGVYYAPAGTIANQGVDPVDPYFVSVENNISLYAGIRILAQVLQGTLSAQPDLTPADRNRIEQALHLCGVMEQGGAYRGRTTKGLRSFLRYQAWHNGAFVQGGRADKPGAPQAWQPYEGTKAVDVNTWGVAAIGAETIDSWHGFGAAFTLWQGVKSWGGYGQGTVLWGVGFSDEDGNGIETGGNYRGAILSTEWTFGAITMVRDMMAHYQKSFVDAGHNQQAGDYALLLQKDEQSMLSAMERLQLNTYAKTTFAGQPPAFNTLVSLPTNPTLYASRRYFIPFGWYANPLPSTCATAWKVMVANRYNPFQPIALK